YEYGARKYDPDLGRFFNIDNYAEKFSDMTPYQYAAINPVVFVDVNGDYIYIHDRDTGIDYKYSYGKLYAKVEGVWKEHTPEAGSCLEFVLTALNNIYDMTSDSSGGDGGAGSWLLGMFENNTINTYIYKGSKYEMSHSYGDITAGFFEKTLGEFMTNQGFSPIDFHIALAHELAHALSFNLINSSIREQVWYNRPNSEHSVKIDEIFATIIENNIRAEQNVPLRTHYQDKGTFENNPTLFEKSRILDQNNQPTIEAMQHLNKYKESGLWKN